MSSNSTLPQPAPSVPPAGSDLDFPALIRRHLSRQGHGRLVITSGTKQRSYGFDLSSVSSMVDETSFVERLGHAIRENGAIWIRVDSCEPSATVHSYEFAGGAIFPRSARQTLASVRRREEVALICCAEGSVTVTDAPQL